MKPFNLSLLDVDEVIAKEGILEITSPLIHAPSSQEFHEDGFFSTKIFGPIASQQRLTRFGYIDLHCQVIHPVIFQNLKDLKSFYIEIISGVSYAVWNDEVKDFDRSTSSDPNADTGITFFLEHLKDIKFTRTASRRRDDKVRIMEKYSDRLLIDKYLVIPAGLRDIKIDGERMSQDDINKPYLSLLNNTKAMPIGGGTKPIYDPIHYAIQRKVNEIHAQLMDLISGKRGFLEDKYGSRHVALGTRNVIASSIMAAENPEDPQYHKANETKVPLYQAAKGFFPLVLYNIKHFAYNFILDTSSDQASVIDPETLNLTYVPISEEEKNRLLSSEGVSKFVELFANGEFRFKPLILKSQEGKVYYPYMIYDMDDTIIMVRDVVQLKAKLDRMHKPYEEDKLRPMTNCELLYMQTYMACNGKHGTVTRYPVTDEQSIYISRCHLISTIPARKVKVIGTSSDAYEFDLPEYPVIGAPVCDALVLHPSRLKPLGGDFDGNCLVGSTTVTIRFTDEWFNKIKEGDYSVSKQNILSVIKYLQEHVFFRHDNYSIAEVRMDEFPCIGDFTIDRNGAKVFQVPTGCEILSFKSNECTPSWEPIGSITVEDECDTVSCKVASKEITVSTNESLAAFDYKTGGIKRIRPSDVDDRTRIPVLKKHPVSYGTNGTWIEGWFLGAMLSDGWTSDNYVGYTKLEDSVCNKVLECIGEQVPGVVHNTYYEEKKEGVKLGNSIKFHFFGQNVVSFGKSLDMYATEPHNDLTKHIGRQRILTGSEDFLWGILCGLLDGAGSLAKLRNDTEVQFRIFTSSPYLRDDVMFLAYRLGLRCSCTTTPPCEWSKESYVLVVPQTDIHCHADKLKFFGSYNQEALKSVDTEFPSRSSSDVIPFTDEEAKKFYDQGPKTHGHDIFSMVKEKGYATRCALMKYIELIDPESPLYRRIMNTDVLWCCPKNMELKGKQRVFDFLVDTTKVFVVNNGVVVYDTVNWIPIMSKEANEEDEVYLQTIGNFVRPNGNLTIGFDDLIKLTLHNMTMDPPAK